MSYHELNTNCPFDHETHIKSAEIDSNAMLAVHELRELLLEYDLFKEYSAWCTDHTLNRFLLAKQYNVRASAELLRGRVSYLKNILICNIWF